MGNGCSEGNLELFLVDGRYLEWNDLCPIRTAKKYGWGTCLARLREYVPDLDRIIDDASGHVKDAVILRAGELGGEEGYINVLRILHQMLGVQYKFQIEKTLNGVC